MSIAAIRSQELRAVNQVNSKIASLHPARPAFHQNCLPYSVESPRLRPASTPDRGNVSSEWGAQPKRASTGGMERTAENGSGRLARTRCTLRGEEVRSDGRAWGIRLSLIAAPQPGCAKRIPTSTYVLLTANVQRKMRHMLRQRAHAFASR